MSLRSVFRLTPLLIAFATLIPAAHTLAGGPDFNNDGFDDLAIGVPFESVGLIGPVQTAGTVHILYGTADGLSSADRQTWHQNSPGIPEQAGTGDHFGYALAWGDFDGDGFDDLAIGVPWEHVGGKADAGCVHVLFGSADGLSTAGNQLWNQNKPNIEDAAENGDLFGYALAAADFNNDGYADLAIGVPQEDLGGKTKAGAVHMLLGSPIGLLGVASSLFHQDTPDMMGTAKKSDFFGLSLATGDFDGDGFIDLAVGAPQDDISGVNSAGAVNILYGTPFGLDTPHNQIFHQNKGAIGDACEANDTFAWSLSAGDFNDDGYDDLAVGVAFERIGSTKSAGAVNIIYGSAGGLTDAGNQFLNQTNLAGGQSPSGEDLMGWALTTGDFNDDGYADLAIGVPGDSVNSFDNAGIVQIVFGGLGGLDPANVQVMSQDTGSVPDEAEETEWFGAALARSDFDGDGIDDLAIGAPFEDDFGTEDVGAIFILFGSLSGITDSGSQMWFQKDMDEVGEESDAMGWSLGK